MRPALLLFAFAALVAGAGCGAQIGDSCVVSTDCSIDGSRICDINSDGGYCTIQGCDYGTCPSEAECVSFFLGSFDNQPCNPATEDLPASGGTDDCNPDELCALDGHCVNRSSEVRYCMLKCSSGGDCRSGYECRDEKLMEQDGGEPVPAPGTRITPDSNPQPFCAQAPSS